MNEAQRQDLLKAAWACARVLGADVAADKPAPEQAARGLAYMLGRLLKNPRLVQGVAAWAVEYMPELATPTKGNA